MKKRIIRNKVKIIQRHFASLSKWRNKSSIDTGYLDPNKWKIRGWNRRLRFLHFWGGWILTPDLKNWHSSDDYIYERYKIYPWYRFGKHRQPPLWFFKELIKQFVGAYDNWDKIFKERKEPYDLFVGIYNPHFILSKVECRRMEENGDKYEYWPFSKVNKPFPFDKFQSNAYDLTKFDWELCIEEDVIFESEFEDSETNEQVLLSKGYEKRENQHGVYFAKRIGDVWMGRKKKRE